MRYLLLLPFLLLSLWAGSWGLADIFAFQGMRYEQSWVEQGEVASLAEWEDAESWLNLAAKFNPLNPDYPESLGKLYNWRFYIESAPITSFEQQQQLFDVGALHLRSAIKKRPTWPLTWANLLELKSTVGQIDDEYWHVWQQSLVLGRWETYVQAKLLESGLLHWQDFDKPQRQKVMSVFADMISKPLSETMALDLAEGYEQLRTLCGRLSAEAMPKKTKVYCKRS